MSKEPGDVDPSIASECEPERSAYDKLRVRLSPLLKDKPLAHLEGEEINALAIEDESLRQVYGLLVLKLAADLAVTIECRGQAQGTMTFEHQWTAPRSGKIAVGGNRTCQ